MSQPVDLSHLARYTGGDRALNGEILRLFDNQLSEMVENLKGVAERRDTKGWQEITHTIKGAARGVGAFGLGDAAAAAEPVDPANGDQAREAIATLESQAQLVRGFIQQYIAA